MYRLLVVLLSLLYFNMSCLGPIQNKKDAISTENPSSKRSFLHMYQPQFPQFPILVS